MCSFQQTTIESVLAPGVFSLYSQLPKEGEELTFTIHWGRIVRIGSIRKQFQGE